MDNTLYFITAATYQKQHLLQKTELKQLLLNYIQSCFQRYQWELHHWVILENHYHLLGKSRKGNDLSKIIQQIHSVSGYQIKQSINIKTQVWWNYWNYWDYCLRHEKDYLIHLNYLLNNPIKHGYVNNLSDYPFSSFHLLLKKQSREYLAKQFRDYSEYKNLTLNEDNFTPANYQRS
jgi:putative transposase